MKWAHDGAVYRGTYCTTQGRNVWSLLHFLRSFIHLGVVQQLGECGVAISTLVYSTLHVMFLRLLISPHFSKIIAAHTFVGVFWKIGTQNRIVALALVGLEWLFIVLFVAISAGIHHSKNDLYNVLDFSQ